MADETKPGPVDSGVHQADIAAEIATAKAAKAEAKAQAPAPAAEPTAQAEVQQPESQDPDEDDGQSAGDEGTQQPETNPGKKNTPRGVQKKLDKLTREKYEAQAQAAYWQQQAQQRQQANPQAQPAQPTPTQAEGKPTLESCGNDPEKYLEALAEWKADQRFEARLQQQRQQEAQAKEQEQKATHLSREKAFAEAHPDYYDVAYTAPINFGPAMLDYITSSEKGPEVAYYLAQHLDEAKAIEQMPPHRQGIALDRIEQKFAAAKSPVETDERPARTVTQAPQPPATIQPAGQTRRNVYDENLSTAERIAMWKRQKRA